MGLCEVGLWEAGIRVAGSYEAGIVRAGIVRAAFGTAAFGINNRGQIVGIYFTPGARHGFILDRGQFVTLDIAASQSNDTILFDINDHGTVVGTFDFFSYGIVGDPVRGR